jgi:multidrug efflux pump subunit AcrB
MKLPRIAIDNYQFTIMIFIMLAFAGIVSYLKMPRTENPSIQVPGASVIVIYPGANPKDLEELIAIPLEEAINELDDIKSIETSIRDGIVSVGVEFIFGTDAKEKYDEVVSIVNSTRNKLPDDIYSLQTIRWSTSDVNIIQLAFVSDMASYSAMRKTAEGLKKEIERIEGIRKVELSACPEQEISISLDAEKMALMNITVDQVAAAVRASNTKIPGGSLVLGSKSFALKSNAVYEDLKDIENTVVQSYNGQLVYLGDIASVRIEDKEQDYIGRLNGRRAIFLAAQQKEDMNLFDIMKKVKNVTSEYKNKIPRNIELKWVFDQSYFVNNRINGFLLNLLQGILLVGVMIFLTMGFRSSLLTMLALPLSIVIGFWVIHISGFGLQQISIAGLIVALGMLVDNSIVMVQNINRFLGMGYSKREAAIKGSEQIGWPIVSATLTTVAAFIPIIMMKDEAGEFIKSLPVAIISTLMASLFIALTLTPFLASRVFKKPEDEDHATGFLRWIHWIIENPYNKILKLALRKRTNAIILTVAIFIVTIFVFIEFVGVSFFPKAEQPQFLIRINLPEGTHISKADKAARFVERVLDTLPDVVHYATNVGHGNPRIYYNTFTKNYAENYAEFYVRLKKYDVEKFDLLVKQLRKIFSTYPGGEIIIKEFEQGTPVLAPVVVTVRGENFDNIKASSIVIENFLKKIPGVINCENELNKIKSDLYFSINKDKASYFGVPTYEIDRTLRTLTSGAAISSFRNKDGKEFDITLRMQKKECVELNDLKKIYIRSVTGKQIPLFQLVDMSFQQSPSLITRKNLQRSANVTADIIKGYTLDNVLKPLTEFLDSYKFPDGVTYTIAGELENRQKSFGGMTEAIIIAMLVIFAILVIQFRSFKQPFIIFVTIPLALIGAIWALFITGNTFSFTAFIGLISLVGIVVNNAIILVDYSNKLVAEGKNVNEAVKEAGKTRFTPIILTSFTTIGGLLPLTFGGGTLWAPMAWGIIGGLLTSTMLTLLIIPVIYVMVTKE